MKRFRIGIFTSTVASVVGSYLFLAYAFPRLAAVIVGSPNPMPMPGMALAMYMVLVLVGAVVYVTASDAKFQEFLVPIVALLKGERKDGLYPAARMAVLCTIPLLVGWAVYNRTAPRLTSPTALRIQHPTIPRAYEKLVNPFRDPTDEAVRAFLAKTGKGDLSPEEGRRAFAEAVLVEGRDLYQKNCRPCHGTKAAGQGPMAGGFRLRPAVFTDPGTIATVVEPYTFWRIKKGGPGLPPSATPWDSAMPVWERDLTDEEIWKIIITMYETAGVEPRKPEKLE